MQVRFSFFIGVVVVALCTSQTYLHRLLVAQHHRPCNHALAVGGLGLALHQLSDLCALKGMARQTAQLEHTMRRHGTASSEHIAHTLLLEPIQLGKAHEPVGRPGLNCVVSTSAASMSVWSLLQQEAVWEGALGQQSLEHGQHSKRGLCIQSSAAIVTCCR